MEEKPLSIEIEEQDFFEHFNVVVDKGQSLLRIDKFLAHRIENTSRNRIQNAIEIGSVLVNGISVKVGYKIKPFDEISIVLPHPPKDTTVYPEDIPIDIVYEDEDLMVVNKAAGMVVHPGFNNYTGTLVNALVFHFGQLPQLPGNDGRPGLVHRIDKDTSGLLLVSKNDMAIVFLAKQFFDHTIQRQYVALVWGDVDRDGVVEGYIGRSSKDRKIMDVFDEAEKGKWSRTHYAVLERFGYTTLLKCELETGRTHQIRAHMQHIGHPLFNDATYGGDKILKGTTFNKYKQFVQNCFDTMPRQALHAQTLGFIHPRTKDQMFFEATLPSDFEALNLKWRKYNLSVD